MTRENCKVDGCEKPRRSGSADWCKMHYHRWYRHGSVEISAWEQAPTVSHGRRYARRYLPGHPLADVRGKVYMHRLALYEKIGPGPHPCHWCGITLLWRQPKGDRHQLHVDHLNDLGDDNRPENLVPSCGPCNTDRGSVARFEALKAAGWFSSHDTVGRLGDRKVRLPA